jgi:polysaccharide export outer membrane protein
MRRRGQGLWLAAAVLLVVMALPGSAMPQGAGDPVGPVPGDLIRLRIWQEPDMSGDFPVDEDGIVVLPRIGRVDVTNHTPASLEKQLIEEYGKYLTHESIDVMLLRRIQVLGAVANPGIYPLDPTMTVADALATAGGATPQGKPRSVELIRSGERVPVELFAETRIADSPIRSGDQLFVPERSWLSRNPGVIIGSLTGALGLAIAILR